MQFLAFWTFKSSLRNFYIFQVCDAVGINCWDQEKTRNIVIISIPVSAHCVFYNLISFHDIFKNFRKIYFRDSLPYGLFRVPPVWISIKTSCFTKNDRHIVVTISSAIKFQLLQLSWVLNWSCMLCQLENISGAPCLKSSFSFFTHLIDINKQRSMKNKQNFWGSHDILNISTEYTYI